MGLADAGASVDCCSQRPVEALQNAIGSICATKTGALLLGRIAALACHDAERVCNRESAEGPSTGARRSGHEGRQAGTTPENAQSHCVVPVGGYRAGPP